MAKTFEDSKPKPAKAAKARAPISTPVDLPTVNLIQFTVNTAPPKGGGAKEPDKEKQAPAEPRKSHARSTEIPDAVLERFVKVGDHFYFPDGAEAFQHQGDRLTTRSENAVVIQGMVAVAQARSADGAVTVKGSDFFRKESWFAASLAGLKVEGYEPSEFERERLARAVARRAAPPNPDKEQDRPPEIGGEVAKRERAPGARPADSNLVTGRLVDHGVAHYRHNPKEDLSYFVRVETAEGDRDIWGVDLERAFRHSLSTPGIGDKVGVRAVGKDAVTVLAAERDEQGNEISRKSINTHRNQWIVERQEFLDQRAQLAATFRDSAITAGEGTRRHPELAGTYDVLELGEVVAQGQYTDKAQRQQWRDNLREHLARRIEYGQPMEPSPPLKTPARGAPEPQRAPDRDHLLTR